MIRKHYSLFFLSLLFLTSCSGKEVRTETTFRVKVAPATVAETPRSKEFPFIAKPFRTSQLSFRISGPVDSFDAYAGNFFRQDDIIASIDQRDFVLRLENAEAAYRRAEADYRRIEALYEKDNVSASNYEQARATWIAAKTAYNTASNELEDTRLRAPFNGYVGEVFIEEYQDVRAAQPVVTLVDVSKLRIEIYVTQDIAMRAEELETLQLVFDHIPDSVFHAEVVECARSTTANNLSYLLTALLPNPGGKLPSGMSGKVFFDMPGETPGVVAVPTTALCHRPSEGNFVWVADSRSGVASMRRVVPGELLPGGRISIESGLRPGEFVAVSGLRFLSDGMQIQMENVARANK